MDFNEEVEEMIYESAVILKRTLHEATDLMAEEVLAGELGLILNSVIAKTAQYPISNIPHFEQMTRGWLPEIEVEYFNFYSLAKNGKPAWL